MTNLPAARRPGPIRPNDPPTSPSPNSDTIAGHRRPVLLQRNGRRRMLRLRNTGRKLPLSLALPYLKHPAFVKVAGGIINKGWRVHAEAFWFSDGCPLASRLHRRFARSASGRAQHDAPDHKLGAAAEPLSLGRNSGPVRYQHSSPDAYCSDLGRDGQRLFVRDGWNRSDGQGYDRSDIDYHQDHPASI